MNERFVAVSTVTGEGRGSEIRDCSSKPRCDFSVTGAWQQMTTAIRWIKHKSLQAIDYICANTRTHNCHEKTHHKTQKAIIILIQYDY